MRGSKLDLAKDCFDYYDPKKYLERDYTLNKISKKKNVLHLSIWLTKGDVRQNDASFIYFSYSLLNGEWESFSVYHLILCAKYLFAYNNCNYITWFSKAEVITFIYVRICITP